MGKRLRSQRRGAGKPSYISPSFKHRGFTRYPNIEEGEGIVEKIIHNPGTTAPLAIVKLGNGKKINMFAHEGLKVGERIQFTRKSIIEPGNVLPLDSIPEGTPIYNIEHEPGDGGKFVRSAGNYATIVSHGEGVIIRLPSGSQKRLHPYCRATIGVVAGGGRKEKPFLKAGKKHHVIASKARKYPITRGVAMNPVDHPHGGGHTGLGRPSTVSKGAPPGRKVGTIGAKRTGKR